MQMNRIEIAGFLAARPEARYLASGTKVANARLGESHRYKGADYQVVTQTNWHSLTFYNALADQAVTYDKGTNLFIEGTVQQRKFTPKDGSERTVHEVIVQSCHVIGNSPPPSGVTENAASQVLTNGVPDHDEAADTWPL
jgi:single-strand DNA-binding protein